MGYSFKEERVIIKGKVSLGATITIPEVTGENLTAIVIVPGTGTADRDGNMKKINMNIYKELAETLTSFGFITIRYDKRGVGESEGDHNKTSLNDSVDDIISNIEYVRKLSKVNKVILCGHSEGCSLVSITNEKYPVDGLIQIGGAGMCIKSALEYQNYGLLQEIQTLKGIKGWLLRRLINENNYMKNVNQMIEKCNGTDKETIRIKGVKIAAKWMREHDSYTDEKLQDLMKNAKCKILAITGERDVQADPKYIDIINSFNMDHIKAVKVPLVNHIIKENNGKRTVLDLMKQYKEDINKPISNKFIEELESWLTVNFIKS